MINPNTTTTTTTTTKEIGIGLELTRKLLLFEHSQTITSNSTPPPRITHEALQAASFLLERFISEARQRALLEAEFDHEKHGYFKTSSTTQTKNETKDDETSKRLKFSHDSQTCEIMKDTSSSSSFFLESNSIVEIQQEHVLKIAAEMLLDFC